MEDQVRIKASIPQNEFQVIVVDSRANVLRNTTTPCAFVVVDDGDEIGTGFYTKRGEGFEDRKSVLLAAFGRMLKELAKLEEVDEETCIAALHAYIKDHGNIDDEQEDDAE